MKKEYLRKGFTLIELLAVIIILSLFVVFAYPNIINTYRNMKMGTMLVKENDIKNNAKSYISDCLDPTMRYSLSGCNNTNALDTSGYVLLSDMVNDQYAEPVEYENTSCEGYISFTEDDYQVCLKCGDRYETDNVNCNFAGQQQPTNTRTEFNFLASGEGQLFTAPTTGKYKIELWGAQGGGNSNYLGGSGGYTSGVITLNAGTKLYVYVGGMGPSSNSNKNNGGVNGGGFSGYWTGGDGSRNYGGGGSTDVRYFGDDNPYSSDLIWNSSKGLASRIMTAAGGGGNFSWSYNGATGNAGNGGGLIGYESTGSYTDSVPPIGATQVLGGKSTNTSSQKNGSFGFAVQSNLGGWGGGGGGGWYGGATGNGHAGSGGSSYISGHLGCVSIKSLTDTTAKCTYPTNSSACSVSPTGLRFTNTVMIDGSGYAWTNVKGSLSQMPSKTYGQYYAVGKGNEGNGFARITKLVEGFEEPHTIKLINNNGTVSQSKISLKSTESTAKVTFTQSCPYVTSSSVSCTGGAIGTISGNELTISNVTEITECTITPDPVVVFDEGHTGQIKTFTPSCNGYYKLEVWGAKGGTTGTYTAIRGGYGGYSVGVVKIGSSNNLYIVVGSKPLPENCDSTKFGICPGGYNGGGASKFSNGEKWGAGGGATHIATVSGLLKVLSSYKDTDGTSISKEILIVAGGGGGSYNAYAGGSAGGYVGQNGTTRTNYLQAYGGTQTSAGGSGSVVGGFGYGGSSIIDQGNYSGGGGGWYGGDGTLAIDGAGGSGYIGSSNLLSAKGITKHMYCYNCGETQTNPAYRTTVGECHDDDPTPDCAKEGDGHATITYIGN